MARTISQTGRDVAPCKLATEKLRYKLPTILHEWFDCVAVPRLRVRSAHRAGDVTNGSRYYTEVAIKSFRCSDTQTLFETGKSRRFSGIGKVAMRKLAMLNRAAVLTDLRIPPRNLLEALKADRAGQHSIRINSQWRVCFRWTGTDAEDVEIVDYH